MEWIPYSQFTNIKEIAKGGFGIIYQATWLDGSLDECNLKNNNSLVRKKRNETVVIKRFENSQDFGKYFLNEVCILIYMYVEFFYSKFINFYLIIVKIKSVLL